MESYTLKATASTPSFTLDADLGTIEIQGRSLCENTNALFDTLYEKIDEYALNPQVKTTVSVKLEYFNTRSSKCILDIFKKLEKMHLSGNQVVVNWYCQKDDLDMFEAGEDYELLLKLPFRIIELGHTY